MTGPNSSFTACMEFLTWPLRNLRGACCFPPAWNERTLAQQQNQWDLINMLGWKCFGLKSTDRSSFGSFHPKSMKQLKWIVFCLCLFNTIFFAFYKVNVLQLMYCLILLGPIVKPLKAFPGSRLDRSICLFSTLIQNDIHGTARRSPSWRSIPDPSQIRPKWRRV